MQKPHIFYNEKKANRLLANLIKQKKICYKDTIIDKFDNKTYIITEI